MLERTTAHPLDTLAFKGLNAQQRQLAESVPMAQRVKKCFEETANAMQDSWFQARDAFAQASQTERNGTGKGSRA